MRGCGGVDTACGEMAGIRFVSPARFQPNQGDSPRNGVCEEGVSHVTPYKESEKGEGWGVLRGGACLTSRYVTL